MTEDLAAIRMRSEDWIEHGGDAVMAPFDRVVLLTVVDRLSAQLDDARAQYDALCREVGRMSGGRS